MSYERKKLCLDFDGVLHAYVSKWVSADVVLDPPVRGAMEFLHEAVDRCEVTVFSSRSRQAGGIEAMKSWLKSNLMSRFGVTEAYRVLSRIEFPEERPIYDLFLDDHGYQFVGQFPAFDEIDAFVPWTKGKSVEEVS